MLGDLRLQVGDVLRVASPTLAAPFQGCSTEGTTGGSIFLGATDMGGNCPTMPGMAWFLAGRFPGTLGRRFAVGRLHARRGVGSSIRLGSPGAHPSASCWLSEANCFSGEASWVFKSRICLLCRRTLLRSSEISSVTARTCSQRSLNPDTTASNPRGKISWTCCGVNVRRRRASARAFGRTLGAVSTPQTIPNHLETNRY